MSTLREAAEPDWLDEEPFYNAMQRYRCAPREDQREIVACFEAVKRLVRAELAKPDAPMVQDGWQLVPVEPTPLDGNDDQAWDRNAERLTREALGADVDRPINMQATSVDDL